MNPYDDREFFDLLTGSYARLVGSPLIPDASGPKWLYHEAPFAILAHNTEPDPRFVYANEAAQRCFEYSWDEFMELRSRFSAQAGDRAERQQLLDAVKRTGFVRIDQEMRVAKSGRRFWIKNGVVWQLVDANGVSQGQAAIFPVES
jgi:PAS domain-containing protein